MSYRWDDIGRGIGRIGGEWWGGMRGCISAECAGSCVEETNVCVANVAISPV